jgi:hypothetical protein
VLGAANVLLGVGQEAIAVVGPGPVRVRGTATNGVLLLGAGTIAARALALSPRERRGRRLVHASATHRSSGHTTEQTDSQLRATIRVRRPRLGRNVVATSLRKRFIMICRDSAQASALVGDWFPGGFSRVPRAAGD